MKTIYLENIKFEYEVSELAKIFLPGREYEIRIVEKDVEPEYERADKDTIVLSGSDKNSVKRKLWRILQEETGYAPPWGTLTGVRPCKITDELYEKLSLAEDGAVSDDASERTGAAPKDAVRHALEDEYLISEKKTELLLEIHDTQDEVKKRKKEDAGAPESRGAKSAKADVKALGREDIGLYIGIPFCPTRCAYCSFPSEIREEKSVRDYLFALFKEVRAAGRLIEENDLSVVTLYIGGGTPTALTDDELDMLLTHIKDNIDMSRCREFTVEAGRPDTITDEKLRIIKKHEAGRISINPQTMKQETLDIIGRRHKAGDVGASVTLAKNHKIPLINMDLIAGLPEENAADFQSSLLACLMLEPQNITVHTLSIKKASVFRQELPKDMPDAHQVEKMLEISREILRSHGYRPYYLYRQKYMSGNFENVGYALPGTESLYNIGIMAEKQTILALGAGGISKFYFPHEDRLERVANVSDRRIYVQRIDEMIARKRDFFKKWHNMPLTGSKSLIQ